MYRTLRLIDQPAAFALLVFVAMYLKAGTVPTYERLFVETVYQEPHDERPVPTLAGGDAENDARSIGAVLGLRPRVLDARYSGDGALEARFENVRTWRGRVPAGSSTASVQERRRHWRAVLLRLHRIHAYAGGSVLAVWAVLHDLGALTMIVFEVAGVLLWWRL